MNDEQCLGTARLCSHLLDELDFAAKRTQTQAPGVKAPEVLVRSIVQVPHSHLLHLVWAGVNVAAALGSAPRPS